MEHLRLIWTDPITGEEQAQTLSLPVSIGRDPQNTLPLSSGAISGRHATIRGEGQRVILDDLNSRNGTFLNGQRIRQTEVQANDVIQIGPYQFLAQTDASDNRVVLSWQEPNGQERQAVQPLPVIVGRDPDKAQIVLAHPDISRQHARVSLISGKLVIEDLNSRNGVVVQGQKVRRIAVSDGTAVTMGPFTVTLKLDSATRRREVGEATLIFSDQQADGIGSVSGAVERGQTWPPSLFDHDVVPVEAIYHSGIPTTTVEYAAIGGGIGSFVWVNHLIIYGANPRQIMVIGPGADSEPLTTKLYGEYYSRCRPYGKYQRLCRNSQIPDHERLRSNSESCPDNLWGWPGYAAREIWHDIGRGDIGHALSIFWQIFGEPVWTNTYTPKSSDVFRSLDREAQRISWARMFTFGYARAIRKTNDGRYVVAYTALKDGIKIRSFVIARYVQIAIGYPALRFLEKFNHYRNSTGDFSSVVNAYEAHEHVYYNLAEHGGVIAMQGRGIVASRLIQRIWELRRKNPNITLIHMMRSPIKEGNRFERAQRIVHNHMELQPFNWPRACWSGQLRIQLEQASPEQRKKLLDDWGGTTTADRRDWINIVEQGKREGWYRLVFGEIQEIQRIGNGLVRVDTKNKQNGSAQFDVNYVADATGVEAKPDASPLLKDMIERYRLPLNPVKRLHVENDFEIRGLRNQGGRVYAAGAITLGGPYAAVDSFLGLQYAAQRSVDALAQIGAPGIRLLSGSSVFIQWLKWAQGVHP
ncbi:FHA domain-containing protein [bacterium]|nr:FHA domain-containing protein [bacterium]